MFAPCRSNCLFVIRAKKVTLSGRVTNAMAPANRRSVCTKGQKVTLPGPTPPKLDPVMGTRLRPRQSAAEAARGLHTAGRNGPQATPPRQCDCIEAVHWLHYYFLFLQEQIKDVIIIIIISHPNDNQPPMVR